MRTQTAEATATSPERSRPRLWLAESLAALLILGYGLWVPEGNKVEVDHLGALQTLAAMRKGKGFYQAFRDSYLSRGTRLGGPRSYRTPYIFLIWREVPAHLLYPAFLVAVVGATTFFLMRCTDRPLVVLPVTLFLLVAGRTPGGQHGGLEGWLLVELWTVPLVAACTWAWKRDKPWIVALTAAGAVLIRELALPVVILGLVFSWRRGKPLKPWLTALAIDIVGWAIHIHLAMQVGVKHGNEAKLWGTGTPPWSVFYMMIYPTMIFKGTTKLDVVLGLIIWGVAMVALWRERASVPPSVGLLVIPLLGFLVSRGYWGLPVIPFVVFWAFDALVHRRAKGHAPAPSSPLGDEDIDAPDRLADPHPTRATAPS